MFRPIVNKVVALAFLFAAATLTGAPSHATLIEQDLNAPGDNLLTIDTGAGLEWLDVTATLGLSYNQAQASPFATTQGFRHADQTEVSALYAAFGITPGIGFSSSNFTGANAILASLGTTGLAGGSFTSPFQGGWLDVVPFSNSLAALGLVQIDGFTSRALASFTVTSSRSVTDPRTGNYLVRAVVTSIPEPGTIFLFIAGLIALGTLRYRMSRAIRPALIGACALALLALPLPANATLISVDDAAFGAGALTRDTDTGFDWLDLVLLGARSFNDISGQFGAGGDFEGFRYAVAIEVKQFFINAGIPDVGDPFVSPTSGISVANVDPTQALISLLGGFTFDLGPTSNQGIAGLTGTFNTPTSVLVASATLQNSIGNAAVGFPNGFGSLDQLVTGHFLIRPAVIRIFEPATLGLFLTGLVALGFVRRRAPVAS